MANKRFGVKEINLVGAAGTPTIESPDNLNINAVNVAISTNLSVGGTVTAAGFSTTTGTSSQFLKADGSVDSNTYLTSYTETDPVVAAINGIVKSDGSTILAATSGTDYLAPSSDGSSLSGIITSISAGTNITLTGGPTGIVTINSSATVDGLWSLDGDNVYYDTAGGNIGIGTTDPTSKLDVDGTLNVSGVSTFQDTVIFDSTSDEGSFLAKSSDDNKPVLQVKQTGDSNYDYASGFDSYRPTQVGTAITTGSSVPSSAIYQTDDEIYQYVRSNLGFFDMDQDGVVSPADAKLVQRVQSNTRSIWNGSSYTQDLILGNGTYTNSDWSELFDRAELMYLAPYTQNVNVGITTTILTGVTTSQVIVGNDYPVGASTFIAANTKVTAIGSGEVTISNATTNTEILTGAAVTFGMGPHGYGMWDITGRGDVDDHIDGEMILKIVGNYDGNNYAESNSSVVGLNPTLGVGINTFLNPPDYGPPRYNTVIRSPRIGIGTSPKLHQYGSSSVTINADLENLDALSVTGKVNVNGTLSVSSNVSSGNTSTFNHNVDVSEFVNGVDISSGNVRLSGHTSTLVGTITTSTSTTGDQNYFGCNVACNSDGSSVMIVGINTDTEEGTISVFDKNGNNYDFVGLVTDTTVIAGYDSSDLPADCVMSDDGNIFAFSSGAARAAIGAGNTIVVWQRSGNTLSQLGLIEYDTLTGWGATEGMGSSSAEFGCSLDMSANGEIFVVGAERDRLSNVGIGTTIKSGRVHVIERNGSTFTGIATLTPDPLYQESLDYFGFNTVISDDGDTIIVAQPYMNNGYIYKFSRVGNTYTQVGLKTDLNGYASGYGLEISGDGTRIFVSNYESNAFEDSRINILDGDLNLLETIPVDDPIGAYNAVLESRKTIQSSYDGRVFVTGTNLGNGTSEMYHYSDVHEKYEFFASKEYGYYYYANGLAITRDGSRAFIPNSDQLYSSKGKVEYYDIISSKVGIGISNPSTELHVRGTATISEGVKGSIRQVVGYSTDATFTTSLTAVQHNAVTDMGVEINLSSPSNKVLVTYDLTGEFNSSSAAYNTGISFARVSGNYATGIVTVTPGNADSGYYNNPDNRIRGITTPVVSYSDDSTTTAEKLSIINFLDSPNTTGIVTYYPTIYPYTNMSWFGNRTVSDTNGSGNERFISYITLQEIVG